MDYFRSIGKIVKVSTAHLHPDMAKYQFAEHPYPWLDTAREILAQRGYRIVKTQGEHGAA